MHREVLLVFLLVVGIAGCGERNGAERSATPDDEGEPPRKIEKVREAAVAGLFYPGDRATLSKLLDGLLARAGGGSPKGLRALICPHAGYRFSGQTAAIAYKQAAGGNFRTVIVLAPSHYARFEGASVPAVDAYRTPLGLIPLSRKADRLATVSPFVGKPRASVRRPGWWVQSPKKAPPAGKDTPHTWEHSLEVQLPFLQKVLKKFTLVPAVFGHVDTKAAAKALETFIDDRTLIVVSTDLSHHHPYEEARRLDNATVAAILRLDADVLTGEDACGHSPVKTLLHLAKTKGWKGRLLDYRNSGDTGGDKARVVGYAAVGFYDADAPKASAPPQSTAIPAPVYSTQERRFLLDLARKTLAKVALSSSVPRIDTGDVPRSLVQPKACFVTLTKKGELRGCIGGFFPREPLFMAVVNMTYRAAMRDKRYKPVRADELAEIEIEISVLTVPRPLKFSSPEDLLARLRPGVDGVILRAGRRQSTYLPQVWEQMPGKEVFLSNLARKAGLPPTAWRQPGVSVLTYQVEAFHEEQAR